MRVWVHNIHNARYFLRGYSHAHSRKVLRELTYDARQMHKHMMRSMVRV